MLISIIICAFITGSLAIYDAWLEYAKSDRRKPQKKNVAIKVSAFVMLFIFTVILGFLQDQESSNAKDMAKSEKRIADSLQVRDEEWKSRSWQRQNLGLIKDSIIEVIVRGVEKRTGHIDANITSLERVNSDLSYTTSEIALETENLAKRLMELQEGLSKTLDDLNNRLFPNLHPPQVLYNSNKLQSGAHKIVIRLMNVEVDKMLDFSWGVNEITKGYSMSYGYDDLEKLGGDWTFYDEGVLGESDLTRSHITIIDKELKEYRIDIRMYNSGAEYYMTLLLVLEADDYKVDDIISSSAREGYNNVQWISNRINPDDLSAKLRKQVKK